MTEMVVTALPPSGVRFSNRFPIDAEGRLQPGTSTRPLGHHPYAITLVSKDGTHYEGQVDVSPAAIGIQHQGYETVEELSVRRVPERPAVRSDAPLTLADAGFVAVGGSEGEARLSNSPNFVYATS